MFKHNGFDKRLADQLENKAALAQSHGEIADAALYTVQAARVYRDENALIAARLYHKAFSLYLKARQVEDALRQATDSFHMLDYTGWLGKSMEQVLDLKEMIGELRSAGFQREAEQFSDLFNQKLGEFGLMLKPDGNLPLPVVCPSCGAALPNPTPDGEMRCTFCGHLVRG